MPTPKLSETQLRSTLRAAAEYEADPAYYWNEKERSDQKSAFQALSEDLGLSHTAVRHHISEAMRRYGWTPADFLAEMRPTPEELEDIPDGRAVLDMAKFANAEYITAARKRWRRVIPVKAEPFAIAFVGDPHIDNKGCDLIGLENDLEAIRASGMRAVNMGDILDSFQKTVKLASKQANNRVSASQGLALARWFIRDSGVSWDAHVVGNHDSWLGLEGVALLKEWGYQAGSKFYDWVAQITYQWDGGSYTCLAAHDFKGSSVYNPLHGNMKRALEDGTADLYVSAHRHNAAQAGAENAFRGKRYEHMRVRGYKSWDEYAHVKGFDQQTEGATGVAVIDPFAETMAGKCRTFLSVTDAQGYLQFLRSR
jgi:hypothetical protein